MKKFATVCFLVFLCGAAYAQTNQLRMIYESQLNTRPVGLYSPDPDWGGIFGGPIIGTFGDGGLDDATGDGVSDLVMSRKNTEGFLQELLVLDGTSNTIFWQVQDVQAVLGDVNLDGFANVLGTDKPQALFSSSEDVLLIDPRDNSTAWSWGETNDGSVRLVGVMDVTKDGFFDVFMVEHDTRQVQVWSIDQ